MITVKALCKSYHQGQQLLSVLEGIDLTVGQGEIFGIIGRSGAGKSTLVRCLNYLERPSSGKVIVDGVDLSVLSERELRLQCKRIGMIFQHFNLLSLRTVAENIALPLEMNGEAHVVIQAKVAELLELVGLADKADVYPEQLSGGQKQRVAIARALACDPVILLSDEATSALDPETTVSILQLLKTINQKLGLTIVLITHEMEVIKSICHRVAILDQGRVVEMGKVVDVFVSPRSEVTRKLTQSALHLELPEAILQAVKSEPFVGSSPIIRIAFVGQSAKEPLLVALYQRFQVSANILQADLEFIDDSPVGICLCELTGSAEQIPQAIAYLNSQGLVVEEIGYV